jgi:hypothetical protein
MLVREFGVDWPGVHVQHTSAAVRRWAVGFLSLMSIRAAVIRRHDGAGGISTEDFVTRPRKHT